MLCEKGSCLPLKRWNAAADMVPEYVRTNDDTAGDWLGRLLFTTASLIWRIVASLMSFMHNSIQSIAVWADSFASTVIGTIPWEVQIFIGAGILIGIVFPPRNAPFRAHLRSIGKRLMATLVFLGLAGWLIAAASSDHARGDDEPGQAAGSPSWVITEINEWADPFVSYVHDSMADSIASTADHSGGVVDCQAWLHQLTEAAREHSSISELTTSRLWETLYHQPWADTAFGTASGEVSCVAAEWQTGRSGLETAKAACFSAGGSEAWYAPNPDRPSAAVCLWDRTGRLPQRDGLNHDLTWLPPTKNAYTSSLLRPLYLCHWNAENGTWDVNKERPLDVWGDVYNIRGETPYYESNIVEACGKWWNSTIEEGSGCSLIANRYVCTPNPLDDGLDAKELSDFFQLDFEVALNVADVISHSIEFLVTGGGDSNNTRAADASLTHPIWHEPVVVQSNADSTVKSLNGQPDDVLTSGFLAFASALTYGFMLTAAALAVSIGGVLMVVGAMILPFAALAFAIEGKPRQVASNAVKLLRNGMVMSIGGYAFSSALLLMVFFGANITAVRYGESDEPNRLFILLAGIILGLLTAKIVLAAKKKQSMGDTSLGRHRKWRAEMQAESASRQQKKLQARTEARKERYEEKQQAKAEKKRSGPRRRSRAT